MATLGYPKRTERNVMARKLKGGSDLTRKYVVKHNRPWWHINTKLLSVLQAAAQLEDWIDQKRINILNVAGCCASKDPEVYDITLAVLREYLATNRRKR